MQKRNRKQNALLAVACFIACVIMGAHTSSTDKWQHPVVDQASQSALRKVSVAYDQASHKHFVEAEVTIPHDFTDVGVTGDTKVVRVSRVCATLNMRGINGRPLLPFDDMVNRMATHAMGHPPSTMILSVAHDTDPYQGDPRLIDKIRVPTACKLGRIQVYHLVCPEKGAGNGWYVVMDENDTYDHGETDEFGGPILPR